MEQVLCNLCGSVEYEQIAKLEDVIYHQGDEFTLVQCRSCGLIYFATRPTAEEIGQYYPPEYAPYRTAIQDERFFWMRWIRRRNIRRRRKLVEAVSPHTPGRCLDVGCSTGIFLDEMRLAGWEVYGLDISEHAAAYARQRFGLNVGLGDLLDAQLPAAAFEAITFWDVLEHTFNPLATLHEARRLLADDGVVVLTIPHWESLERRWFGSAWNGYDTPRHLYAFPRPVLQRLLETAGFRVIQAWCGLSSYYAFLASLRRWLAMRHAPPRLTNDLLRVLNFPGVRILFQPGFSVIEWMGLGGSLVVTARKVSSEESGERVSHGN